MYCVIKTYLLRSSRGIPPSPDKKGVRFLIKQEIIKPWGEPANVSFLVRTQVRLQRQRWRKVQSKKPPKYFKRYLGGFLCLHTRSRFNKIFRTYGGFYSRVQKKRSRIKTTILFINNKNISMMNASKLRFSVIQSITSSEFQSNSNQVS